MEYVFFLLLLGSLLMLVIGLVSPKAGLFWKKGPRSRKQVGVFYGCAIGACFFGTVLFIPHKKGNSANATTDSGTSSAGNSNFDLAKSCDTNWRFINQPEKYLQQTGYIVAPYVAENGGINWKKRQMTIATFSQAGPASFEEDRRSRLTVKQPVQVLNVIRGRYNNNDYHFLEVRPVGSSDRYYIDETNFTLKDVNGCTVMQKAKNEFLTLAEYVVPESLDERPINEPDGSWIDIPGGTYVLVKKYNDVRQLVYGEIYGRDGTINVPYVLFQPATLRELK